MKKERNTLSRRSEILQHLETKDSISIVELSEKYGISNVSIRNDLKQLEEKGLLIRTRGGAIKTKPKTFDLSLNQRLKKNYKQKQAIGHRSIDYIKDGDSIVMDSGSTTLEVAKNLGGFKNIKLVTNSLPIAEEVVKFKNIEVIIPGGVLRSDMRSLTGALTKSNLLGYYCDIAFIGTDGIDSEHGLSTPIAEEAAICQTMIKVARKTIIVADSSKFRRKSFSKIVDISDVDVIITDDNLHEDEQKKFKNLNVEFVVV